MLLYKRVFLVDDDSDDRALFLDALMEIDGTIHFTQAENGAEAIKLLSADILEKPEIIFLDLNMPIVNGKELLRKLKSSMDLSPIPIIMYSTFFGPGEVEEIISLGAAQCMVKHTSFRDLINSLKVALSKKW